VQDTGCGILSEERDRIFQAFYTTKTNGTGLGLSIVEGVLRNHGGKIFVEQPEGAGTRIVLCLPAGGETAAVRRDGNDDALPERQGDRTVRTEPSPPETV